MTALVPVVRVQVNRRDGVQNSVLLHVHQKDMVHEKLKELPDYTDGHGKAEGHYRHEKGRQIQGHPLIAVEQVHQSKANSGAQKAVHGMKHGVPIREGDIERLDFPQNLRSKNEQ